MWDLRRSLRSTLAISLVLILGAAMLVSTPRSAGANTSDKAATLTNDKRIIHLLSRIGFGPRPGDIEAVRRMGIDKYIDLQLHPERISDASVEAKLSGLETLHMPIGELYEKYPQPGAVAKQLGIRGQGAAPVQKPDAANNPQGQASPESAGQVKDTSA